MEPYISKELEQQIPEITKYVDDKYMELLKEIHERFSAESYHLAIELFSSNFIIANVLCWCMNAKYDPAKEEHKAKVVEIINGACKISIEKGLKIGEAIIEKKSNEH